MEMWIKCCCCCCWGRGSSLTSRRLRYPNPWNRLVEELWISLKHCLKMLITCLPFLRRDRLRLKPSLDFIFSFFFQFNTQTAVRLVGSQSWSPANNQCPLTARGGLKCRVWRGNIKTSIKPNWSLKYHNCTTFSIVINYWTSANPLPPENSLISCAPFHMWQTPSRPVWPPQRPTDSQNVTNNVKDEVMVVTGRTKVSHKNIKFYKHLQFDWELATISNGDYFITIFQIL